MPLLAALAICCLQQQPELDAILDDPKLKGAVVAACVLGPDGAELYSRNPDLRVMPASNQKLVTAAFALQALGEQFRPQTRIWKLRDRLIIDTTGDPMLTHAALLEARSTLGLTRDLPVYVRQPFKSQLPPGWEWDDLPNKYAAKVSGLTVDRGSFELWAVNGRLEFRPRNYGVRAKLYLRPGAAKVRYNPDRGLAEVIGTLPRGVKRLDTLALPQPDAAAASILGSTFTAIASVPQIPPTVAISGETMDAIVKEMLVESDNNIAEHLLLLAARVGSEDAEPYTKAFEGASAFLKDVVGADELAFRVHDGSGLSRHNLATARGMAQLLAWADTQPWRDLWRDSLARPGNGTLEKRLEGIKFEGKTGTLDMVAALSGYLTLDDGRGVIAAIFLNHQASSSAESRVFLDRFVKALLDLGNRGTLFASPHEHEGLSPDPRPGPSHDDRLRRSVRHREPSQHGRDSGAQPDHEGSHRAERAAVRAR